MNPENWPDVPEQQRPKKLFVNMSVPATERVVLASKGWEVVDTRLMPCGTDNERLEAVKATLEGIRLGSIEPDKNMKDFLDLEMYVLGVKGKGAQSVDKGNLEHAEMDVLLQFGGARVSQDFRDRMVELEASPKRKPKKKKEVK